MPNPYKVLGVLTTDDEATIRARYLELIRKYTPEQHPQQFADICHAYERIGTLPERAKYHLYKEFTDDTIADIIEELECLMPTRQLQLTNIPYRATYIPLDTPS